MLSEAKHLDVRSVHRGVQMFRFTQHDMPVTAILDFRLSKVTIKTVMYTQSYFNAKD